MNSTQRPSLYLIGARLHGDDGIKGDEHDHDSHTSQHRWTKVLQNMKETLTLTVLGFLNAVKFAILSVLHTCQRK